MIGAGRLKVLPRARCWGLVEATGMDCWRAVRVPPMWTGDFILICSLHPLIATPRTRQVSLLTPTGFAIIRQQLELQDSLSVLFSRHNTSFYLAVFLSLFLDSTLRLSHCVV